MIFMFIVTNQLAMLFLSAKICLPREISFISLGRNQRPRFFAFDVTNCMKKKDFSR